MKKDFLKCQELVRKYQGLKPGKYLCTASPGVQQVFLIMRMVKTMKQMTGQANLQSELWIIIQRHSPGLQNLLAKARWPSSTQSPKLTQCHFYPTRKIQPAVRHQFSIFRL